MKFFFFKTIYSFTLWTGILTATFLLFHVVPADPARILLGQNASEEQVATVRQRLGLDDPLVHQFFRFFGRAVRFDFGSSFVDGRLVGPEVRKKIVLTTSLAGMSLLYVSVYLTIHVLLLVRSRKWRRVGEISDFLLVSQPTLFAAVIVAIMAISCYPFTRFSGSLDSLADWLYLLPPAFVLALYPMGILGRILRNQINQISDTDYVRTARSLGLAENTIMRGYILRNSWVPILAAFGNQLPLLFTSTFIVEIVFSVPGIGSLLLKSVLERDLPMMQGIVIATSLLTLAVTLTLEIFYPLIDRRIGSRDAR